VSAIFIALATTMLVGALALVLRPLLAAPTDPRTAQRRALDRALADGVLDAAEHAAKRAALEQAPAPMPTSAPRPWLLAGTIGAALTAGTLAVYLTQGTPAALDPAALTREAEAPELERLLEGLRARLAEAPDDPAGWALLARGYRTVGRLAEAASAYGRASALAPDDADLLVEAAETMALARPDRSLAGEPKELLQRALTVATDHQRGLWLLGIAHAQAGEDAAAIDVWTRLEALLPPGSEVATAVAGQITEARERLADRASDPDPETGLAIAQSGGSAATEAPEPAHEARAASGAATGAGGLTVIVDLAPSLAARVPPGATLFVFARAAEGPRVPLAIARRPAAGFPVTVTLDDSNAMVAGLDLSSQPRVVVGARISASGNATPQSGDLEALSDPFEHATVDEPLRLTIARVLP
jgi:cytochrome c-type biogenesis protein CcmH